VTVTLGDIADRAVPMLTGNRWPSGPTIATLLGLDATVTSISEVWRDRTRVSLLEVVVSQGANVINE
jgi:hypothetical protein